jgi:hypothetical protein
LRGKRQARVNRSSAQRQVQAGTPKQILSATLRWAKAAKKRKKVALARLTLGWQGVRKMNVSQNQFSLTRAAPSTSGRAKKQILIISSI